MLSDACVRLTADSGQACQPRIVVGDPSEALAVAACPGETAAIVLGPHRRRLIRDILVDTTGERVIRAACVPVLSVDAAPDGPYRRMLLALATLGAALPRAGFSCEREVVVDADRPVPGALIFASARQGCDAIALGARGCGGLESLTLGSVAASVLARAPIDVLAVPSAASAAPAGAASD
jgi:nucleotide-binding universal stress UspA family protein